VSICVSFCESACVSSSLCLGDSFAGFSVLISVGERECSDCRLHYKKGTEGDEHKVIWK